MDIVVQMSDAHFAALHALSLQSGMKFQDVLDAAISEYLERKKADSREHVLTALKESMSEYDALYRELAK